MGSTVIQVWKKCGWEGGTPITRKSQRSEKVVLAEDSLKFGESVEATGKVYDHRANVRQPHWHLSILAIHLLCFTGRKATFLFFSKLWSSLMSPEDCCCCCSKRIVHYSKYEMELIRWANEHLNLRSNPSYHFMGDFHESYTLDLIITQGLHILWPLTTSLSSWLESR